MAENTRPPVAIRIVRPYDTEEELLEHELETVGKTSIVLIGAHPRPTGVILRFEVTLASGATVLRGEGRVLAHKENAFRGQPGLSLRFTRLDPRSKSVVDRATAKRDARGHESGAPSRPPAPNPDAAIADALTASTPEPGVAAVGAGGTRGLREAAPDPVAATQAEQEAAVATARAAAREKANATARANAKRTAVHGGLTPPPVPASVPPAAAPASVAPASIPPESAPAASVPPGSIPPESAPAASVPPVASVPPTASPEAVPPPALIAAHDDDAPGDRDEPTPAPTPVTSIPGLVAEKPWGPRAEAPRAKPASVRPRAASERPAVVPAAVASEPPPSAPALALPAARSRPPAVQHVAVGEPLAPPPDRAALLERLRSRAGGLAVERVAAILAARPPRAGS